MLDVVVDQTPRRHPADVVDHDVGGRRGVTRRRSVLGVGRVGHENADLIREKKPSFAFPTTSPRPSANSREQFGLAVGQLQRHLDAHDRARRSPRPRPRRCGTPRWRRTNSRPGCVPAGMTSCSVPSSVSSSSDVPSAAWAIEIGTSVTRSWSSRTYRSCGATRRWTYRSPDLPAARAGSAAPGQPQRRAAVDPGRHVDLVRLVDRDPALAAAGLARRGDHLAHAAAPAARAGGDHLAEQALAHPLHLAGPVALAAGDRLVPLPAPVPLQSVQRDRQLQGDVDLLAEHRLLEGDVDDDLHVLTAWRAGRSALPAPERAPATAEERLEDVAEAAAEQILCGPPPSRCRARRPRRIGRSAPAGRRRTAPGRPSTLP